MGKRNVKSSNLPLPHLFSVHIPLETQLHLLAQVQLVLERACYAFLEENAPDALRKNGWNCPQAAELNLLVKELYIHKSAISYEDTELVCSLPQLLDIVADIRHTPVHRVLVTARQLEQFIVCGENLASILRDGTCLNSLTKFRQILLSAIGELEYHQNRVRRKLAVVLNKISAQRRELDRLEREALDEVMAQDMQYQVIVGERLEEAICSIEAVHKSRTVAILKFVSFPHITSAFTIFGALLEYTIRFGRALGKLVSYF